MRNSFLTLSCALVCALAIGCESPSTTQSDGKADMQSHDDHGHSHDDHGHSHDDHGHSHDDHGHSHDEGAHEVKGEEMGPNKGHIVRLEPADYMAEWRHYMGNNVIRIYVLDSNKKTVAVNGTVTVTPETGKSKDPFELVPEDADDQGKTGVFMLDEQALSNAMNLGVVIKFEIDGKEYSGKVPPHPPHHH